MDSSTRRRVKRGFLVLVGETSSRFCGIVLPVSTGWWCDKGKTCSGAGNWMRLGIVASSAEELSPSVGIHGGLLHRFGGVMLTVMYRVTGCIDRPASPTSFSRTQGISACEIVFS